MSNLKKCPFCGGEAKICGYYFIQCTKCGVSTLTHTDRESAINTWNTRIPTVEAKPVEWIPCSERLPKEHDSMFKKHKGTDKWQTGMFESISNEVIVTLEFENGKTATTSGHTIEGKWSCEREYAFGTKVIAWMPLPAPYNAERGGKND